MARSLGQDPDAVKPNIEIQTNTGRRSIGKASEDGNIIEKTDNIQGVIDNYNEYDEESTYKNEKRAKKHNAKVLTIVLTAALASVVGLFCYSYFFNGSSVINQLFSFFAKANAAQENIELIYDDGKIYKGVSVLGIDLSGMSKDEAAAVISKATDEKINSLNIAYKVEDNTFYLSNLDLGAEIIVEDILTDALSYGRTGNFSDRVTAIKEAETNGYAVPIDISFHEDTLKGTLKNNGALAPIEPVNASLQLKKVSDEEKLITDMEITYMDGKNGSEVDIDKLARDIIAAAKEGRNDPVVADIKIVEPKLTTEAIKDTYTERGVFSTEFKSSKDGRRYNIWKMSNVINGVKIEPGEQWSINEEAGPRTFALGWQAAPGINEGVYKEEAGGGICQVSSTLYNAVLRAEVEIVDRSHHSWPLEYVDGGLDATISTGAPDFVIKNNFDVPIYIVARCDGEDARKVEVAILAPPYEDGLTRDFISEKVDEFGKEDPIIILDSSMPKGERYEIIKEHKGKTFNVYKRLLDANGNEVSKELAYTDTYAYKPAQIRVGTGSKPQQEQPVQTTPVTPTLSDGLFF